MKGPGLSMSAFCRTGRCVVSRPFAICQTVRKLSNRGCTKVGNFQTITMDSPSLFRDHDVAVGSRRQPGMQTRCQSPDTAGRTLRYPVTPHLMVGGQAGFGPTVL